MISRILLFIASLFLFVACHQDDSVVLPEITTSTGSNRNCDTTAPIYDDVTDQETLIITLKECFTPNTTFTYFEAREFLYNDVDVLGGKVQCIYSGYETTLNRTTGQSIINAAANAGINCEHVFPQSMGSGNEPAKSDMFHIYPALGDVNSARSNKKFAEINDANATRWFYLQDEQTTVPTSNIDLWSEESSSSFEPREDVKGDVARSVFYFMVIYENVASQDYFNSMKDVLLQWNNEDPVDNKELNRNNKIKQYQGNDNPFILDPSLADRIFAN